MLRDRDITVVIPGREEGKPQTVRLEHKPTGAVGHGSGKDYFEAKEQAMEELTREVAVVEAAAEVRAKGSVPRAARV